MKYAYEDLSAGQFEDLVVAICQFILGSAVQGFADGKDGGRDAKFVGTAELLPSKAAPWQGITIVQAKHTNAYNKTFSDADFYSDKNNKTVLGEELPRIKKLRKNGQMDHYLLFSNRRLTGMAESKHRAHVAVEAGIPETSVMLCGVEQLELWLKRFGDAARIAGVDPIDSPLIVSPDELAEVVERLAAHLKSKPAYTSTPVARVLYQDKNELNNMTKEYATELRRRYLKETQHIKSFLAAPENADLQARYEAAADDFQLQVLAKRKDHQTFDEVFNYLTVLLFGRQQGHLRRLQDLRAKIRELSEGKEHLQAKVETDVEHNNSDRTSMFSSIRQYFSEIVEEVVDRKALLSVSPNKNGHLEFKAEILDESGNSTSADLGNTYRKLLCIAFDLALTRAHLDGRYPRFVFHDGVLESLDDRKKLNLVDVLRSHSELGIQQIVTLIDSDLPRLGGDEGGDVFTETEVVLRLHDEGDAGRLFKMGSW